MLQVRRALGEHAGALRTERGGYVLRVEPGELDADRFEQLHAEGRAAIDAGDHAAAAKRLREALALWRGPPLADLSYEGFAQPEIARLEDERSQRSRTASRPTSRWAATPRSCPSSRPRWRATRCASASAPSS